MAGWLECAPPYETVEVAFTKARLLAVAYEDGTIQVLAKPGALCRVDAMRVERYVKDAFDSYRRGDVARARALIDRIRSLSLSSKALFYVSDDRLEVVCV